MGKKMNPHHQFKFAVGITTLCNVILILIVFLLCMIPPDPITIGEVWCTHGDWGKACNRSILYPIIMCILSMSYYALSFCACISSDMCVYSTIATVGTMVEAVACGAWIGAAAVNSEWWRSRHWDEKQKIMIEVKAYSWCVAVVLIVLIALVHLISTSVYCFFAIHTCQVPPHRYRTRSGHTTDVSKQRYNIRFPSLASLRSNSSMSSTPLKQTSHVVIQIEPTPTKASQAAKPIEQNRTSQINKPIEPNKTSEAVVPMEKKSGQ